MAARRSNALSERIAKRVVRLRQQRGMTREQVAEQCAGLGWPEVTYGVITNIEQGRRDADGRRRKALTVDELAGLAAAFGMDAGDLLRPDSCAVCSGAPPSGFTCNDCGRVGERMAP